MGKITNMSETFSAAEMEAAVRDALRASSPSGTSSAENPAPSHTSGKTGVVSEPTEPSALRQEAGHEVYTPQPTKADALWWVGSYGREIAALKARTQELQDKLQQYPTLTDKERAAFFSKRPEERARYIQLADALGIIDAAAALRLSDLPDHFYQTFKELKRAEADEISRVRRDLAAAVNESQVKFHATAEEIKSAGGPEAAGTLRTQPVKREAKRPLRAVEMPKEAAVEQVPIRGVEDAVKWLVDKKYGEVMGKLVNLQMYMDDVSKIPKPPECSGVSDADWKQALNKFETRIREIIPLPPYEEIETELDEYAYPQEGQQLVLDRQGELVAGAERISVRDDLARRFKVKDYPGMTKSAMDQYLAQWIAEKTAELRASAAEATHKMPVRRAPARSGS